MTPRERFVHFVTLFVNTAAGFEASRFQIIEDAMNLSEAVLSASHTDEAGVITGAAVSRPMEAAWEFVDWQMQSYSPHGPTSPSKPPVWMKSK